MAVNCTAVPAAARLLVGTRTMDMRTELGRDGVVTMRVTEPETLLSCAPMVVAPAPTPVARPEELMVAVVWLLEDQVTDEVTFCAVPSV